MKHQMLSILTGLSVALAPLSAFAGKNEGGGPPKNNCDPDMVDRLWRSDNTEMKDEFQNYYLTAKKKRQPAKESEFCDQFAERFNTEAGYCADGDCSKSKHNPPLAPIKQVNDEDEPAARRYRGDEPPRVVEKVVYRDRPADSGGGGLGGLFNGNPMGYMLAGGLGGLIGAMMAGNNNNNNMMMRPPMFRAPYGPYGPMGPGGMMGGGMPPRYMPYNNMGGAPGIIGLGGAGGAPGVIGGTIPYNGANIYNGGYNGGFTSNYFNSAPAVINASTGMRMYSVGGATTAPQYHLLGK
jgi:hypothetical protein